MNRGVLAVAVLLIAIGAAGLGWTQWTAEDHRVADRNAINDLGRSVAQYAGNADYQPPKKEAANHAPSIVLFVGAGVLGLLGMLLLASMSGEEWSAFAGPRPESGEPDQPRNDEESLS